MKESLLNLITWSIITNNSPSDTQWKVVFRPRGNTTLKIDKVTCPKKHHEAHCARMEKFQHAGSAKMKKVSHQTGNCCGSPTADTDRARCVLPNRWSILENKGGNVSCYIISRRLWRIPKSRKCDRFPDAFRCTGKNVLGVVWENVWPHYMAWKPIRAITNFQDTFVTCMIICMANTTLVNVCIFHILYFPFLFSSLKSKLPPHS